MLLPALAAGNSVVLLAADDDPCVAVTFAEVLATSDVPAGLVNVLTGHRAEVLRPGWPRTATSTAWT